MTSMKIVQFSRPHHPPPTPLSRHVPWTSNNFKQIIPPPPLGPRLRSPNDNQLIKRKHNPRMNIMLSEFSFKSAFVFSISSLILSGFPMASFHLAEANLTPRVILKYEKLLFRFPLLTKRCAGVKHELKPHYLLFRGFILLCAQLSKNITKCILIKIILFNICNTHFTINLFYLHILKT